MTTNGAGLSQYPHPLTKILKTTSVPKRSLLNKIRKILVQVIIFLYATMPILSKEKKNKKRTTLRYTYGYDEKKCKNNGLIL